MRAEPTHLRRIVAHEQRALVAVLLVASIVGAYFVTRYAGLWSEQDTSVFARAGHAVIESGRLEQSGYEHGYGYQVWLAQFAMATGVPIGALLQRFLPIVSSLLLGLLGFTAFRGLLGSARLGVMAAAAVFLVPELVFTVARGNHEKLTVSLTLMALLSLLQSFMELDRRRRWPVFAGWVTVYYATAYSLASMNAFFGSTFILASTVALAFAFLGSRILPSTSKRLTPIARRLVIVSATSWSLVVVVMFFAYPPAGGILNVLSTGSERVAALVLSGTPESDPYAVTATDWRSRGAYQLLSSFRWVLLLTSMAVWLGLVRQIFVDVKRVPLNLLYLIALYAAFALQVAAAMVVDLTGLAAGSNLQVRLYPYFTLLAIPLLVMGMHQLAQRLSSSTWRRTWNVSVGALLAVFAVFSLAKATLDPAVANRWLFYHPAEMQAMRFWDEHAMYSALWVGWEPRLRHAYALERPNPIAIDNENRFIVERADRSIALSLDSALIRENAVAWKRPMPPIVAEDRPYDNGFAAVAHRIPRTPFQR